MEHDTSVYMCNRYNLYHETECFMNIQARARSPEGELPCILHKTRRFLMLLCVLYHDNPLPTCNNNNINRKELYYTAITLTAGYIYIHVQYTINFTQVQQATVKSWFKHNYGILLTKKQLEAADSCGSSPTNETLWQHF